MRFSVDGAAVSWAHRIQYGPATGKQLRKWATLWAEQLERIIEGGDELTYDVIKEQWEMVTGRTDRTGEMHRAAVELAQCSWVHGLELVSLLERWLPAHEIMAALAREQQPHEG